MRINPGDALADSNLLLRFVQPKHPHNSLTVRAMKKVRDRGGVVRACSQNFIEFWAVATRPISVNGLGYNTAQAERELAQIEALFPLLPDSPAIYPEWRRLVTRAGVSGKPTHDARLLATALAHGVSNLLTFNVTDFTRFAAFAPSVAIIDPNTV